MSLIDQIVAEYVDDGIRLRPFQQKTIETVEQKKDAIIVAPTSGGKTLAILLSSLIAVKQHSGSKNPIVFIVIPLRAILLDVENHLKKMNNHEKIKYVVMIDDNEQDTAAKLKHIKNGMYNIGLLSCCLVVLLSCCLVVLLSCCLVVLLSCCLI